eukprot:1058443-Prymnesium_polylepis.1
MESCLAKDWYWVLVALSLSIGIVLEHKASDSPRGSPSVSDGKYGKIWSRVRSSCCNAPTRCMM